MTDIVNNAEQMLLRSGLLNKGATRSRWRDVSWKSYDHQLVACPVCADGDNILLFPSLRQMDGHAAALAVVHAFGRYIADARWSQTDWALWRAQAVPVEPRQIDDFATKLAQNSPTFRTIVETSKTAVDRLVAIHLANALIANGLSPEDSRNVDIRVWGPTAAFANGSKPYSLRPLVGAYAPQLLLFADALVEYAGNGLLCIGETSVRAAYKKLVESLL